MRMCGISDEITGDISCGSFPITTLRAANNVIRHDVIYSAHNQQIVI